MHIRPAVVADAERIAYIHAASWKTTYHGLLSPDFMEREIFDNRARIWAERFATPNPRQYVIVAEEGSDLVGFACAFGERHPEWGTMLDNLHMDPEHRGRGVGRQLIVEIARWAAAQYPDDGLYLWVLKANTRAQRFYERLGAVCLDEGHWNTPSGERVPEFCYGWPSPQALLDKASQA